MIGIDVLTGFNVLMEYVWGRFQQPQNQQSSWRVA